MTVASVANESAKSLILRTGAPYGTRTRVTAVKGRCPRPLDEGRVLKARRHIKRFAATGKKAGFHHFPVLGIETHGSFGGSGEPFCSSSIDCLSGERTKAIWPSRGGRLMVTPAFINFSHSA